MSVVWRCCRRVDEASRAKQRQVRWRRWGCLAQVKPGLGLEEGGGIRAILGVAVVVLMVVVVVVVISKGSPVSVIHDVSSTGRVLILGTKP